VDDGSLVYAAFNGGRIVAADFSGQGLVFTSSGYSTPTLRAIRPDGRGEVATSHIAWESRANVPLMPSFVYADGLLFCVKETGFRLLSRCATGQVVWQERLGGAFGASPVLAEGRLYCLAKTARPRWWRPIASSRSWPGSIGRRVQGISAISRAASSFAPKTRSLSLRRQSDWHPIRTIVPDHSGVNRKSLKDHLHLLLVLWRSPFEQPEVDVHGALMLRNEACRFLRPVEPPKDSSRSSSRCPSTIETGSIATPRKAMGGPVPAQAERE